MTTPQPDPEMAPTTMHETQDCSLVLGGPLYQLYRRIHISGDALELLHRRILVITAYVWLPLLLLSLLDGRAFGNAVKVPFLYHIEAHVRFLIALPVLIAAELVVHRRISPVVFRFVERRIVVDEDLPKLTAAVKSFLRLRNSVPLELSMLVLVYTVGLWIWRSHIAVGVPTWYAIPEAAHLNLTLPGYWYAYVSIPVFQFILLRWYLRIVLWFRLLWHISKLNLRLTAAHPDRAGGLGFLGKSTYAFGPILFAQGALLSATIASRVLYEGQSLLSFKVEAVGLIGGMVLFVMSPLFVFSPQLDRAMRKGIAEYALLANRYVFAFEDKWIRGGPPDVGELLGTGDIQSLSDIGNSFSVVGQMRLMPFGLVDVTRLAAATAAPLLPLALTVFSLEEVLTRLVKILI